MMEENLSQASCKYKNFFSLDDCQRFYFDEPGPNYPPHYFLGQDLKAVLDVSQTLS